MKRAAAPTLPLGLVARMCATGVARYGELGLPQDVFAASATARLATRLRKLSRVETEDALVQWAARCAHEDLYLAVACEANCQDAWAVLTDALTPRLQGLARKRGLDAARADVLAGEVLSDLASPVSATRSQTLLSTYRGTGSLFSFTAVVLVRRLSQERRRRGAGAHGIRPDESIANADLDDPSQRTEAREASVELRAALSTAWSELTPRESLVLVLKYRDGLPQRRIAALLGLSESRVSHLLTQGLGRLRASLESSIEAPPVNTALQDELAAMLRSVMTRSGPMRPLPNGGDQPQEP